MCVRISKHVLIGGKFIKEGLDHCTHCPKILPMKVKEPQDLSSTWKSLLVGGTAKVAARPCHLCLVSSASLAHFKSGEERRVRYK